MVAKVIKENILLMLSRPPCFFCLGHLSFYFCVVLPRKVILLLLLLLLLLLHINKRIYQNLLLILKYLFKLMEEIV